MKFKYILSDLDRDSRKFLIERDSESLLLCARLWS